jgi:hypothetical protein
VPSAALSSTRRLATMPPSVFPVCLAFLKPPVCVVCLLAQGGDAAPELVLETLAAATAAVAASNGAAPVDAQEEEVCAYSSLGRCGLLWCGTPAGCS